MLGGPSGVGKTSVSYRLARHFGVGMSEQDDLHLAVEAMTTPDQIPLLHYWRTHPESRDFEPQQILDIFIGVCRRLTPALDAVIANHVETKTPIVLEGDYALPEILAPETRLPGAPMGALLGYCSLNPRNAKSNGTSAPEPNDDHFKRARVSWLHGEWLKAECERFGLVALPARPWETVLERVIEAIDLA